MKSQILIIVLAAVVLAATFNVMVPKLTGGGVADPPVVQIQRTTYLNMPVYKLRVKSQLVTVIPGYDQLFEPNRDSVIILPSMNMALNGFIVNRNKFTVITLPKNRGVNTVKELLPGEAINANTWISQNQLICNDDIYHIPQLLANLWLTPLSSHVIKCLNVLGVDIAELPRGFRGGN